MFFSIVSGKNTSIVFGSSQRHTVSRCEVATVKTLFFKIIKLLLFYNFVGELKLLLKLLNLFFVILDKGW